MSTFFSNCSWYFPTLIHAAGPPDIRLGEVAAGAGDFSQNYPDFPENRLLTCNGPGSQVTNLQKREDNGDNLHRTLGNVPVGSSSGACLVVVAIGNKSVQVHYEGLKVARVIAAPEAFHTYNGIQDVPV